MAKRSSVGNAAKVKQVNTLTIANTWATSDTVTLTIDNIDVVITVGANTTTAQVATTIKEAFNGETLTDTTATVTPNNGVQNIGQFAEIVATVSGSVVTFTARNGSKPFVMTATESTAGSGTASMATPTACTGPTFFSQQDNWSGNTVPVDNDTIVFEQSSQSIQDGLNTGIQPAVFEHHMSFTGWIGRPERNEDNASLPYIDYRDTALQFDNNSVTAEYVFGIGEGNGAAGIRIDAGSGRSNFTVRNSRAANNGVPNITLAGTHVSNTLTNLNGSVGIAYYAGETTTLVSLVNGQGEQGSNAETFCGLDAILSSCVIKVISGKLTTNSGIGSGSVTIEGGTMIHNAGGIGEVNLYNGGTLKIGGSLTITDAYIDGRLDLSQTSGTVTFTDCEFGPNADVYAPAGNIAFTNPYVVKQFSKRRFLNFGPNHTYDLA